MEKEYIPIPSSDANPATFDWENTRLVSLIEYPIPMINARQTALNSKETQDRRSRKIIIISRQSYDIRSIIDLANLAERQLLDYNYAMRELHCFRNRAIPELKKENIMV